MGVFKKLFLWLVKARQAIGNFFTGLPFWSDVEKISMFIAGPIQGVASLTLKTFPFLKRQEKYLEIESLKKRPPVILALSVAFLVFRGLMTSPNGHIGTDTSVFPALTLVSAFNPFLGGLCGIVFGGADLIQKLVNPDIFGAMTRTSSNYPGAMLGYVIAYSITIWMGVAPGVMTRIGRNIAISMFLKAWRARVASKADGAIPPGEEAAAGGAALLGGMLGGALGGYTGVSLVAPILEFPAFYLRPEPDVSCYQSEVKTLRETAPRSGGAGIVGGAVVATTPTTDPPPGRGGKKPPPVPEGDPEGDQDPMDPEELPWEVPGPDGETRRFATKEDAQKYLDDLDQAEKQRQAEDDYKNAVEQIGFLENARRGLVEAGRDTTAQDRQLDNWRRNLDKARNKVNELGGSTDYQAGERGGWSFGHLDEMLDNQKAKRDLLRDIHKTGQTTRNLVGKGIIRHGEGQTENILDRLGQWSNNIATGEGKQPTQAELDQLQDILRGEIDTSKALDGARNTNWVKDGAQMTSREVFTGVNPDGKTSYKSIVLRGLTGVLTGGSSEYVMEVGDKVYIVHDEVQKGKDGFVDVMKTVVKRVVTDELTGRVFEKGLSLGGKIGGAGYDTFVKGTSVDEVLTSGVNKAKNILNRDLDELIPGGGSKGGGEVAIRPKVEVEAPGPGKSLELDENGLKRKDSFDLGRKDGAKKVDDLKEALDLKKKNPDSPMAQKKLDDAVDAVQQDKHAMQDLNRRGQDPVNQDLRKGFNKELDKSYTQSHNSSKQRIAKEYDVPVEKVKVVQPTNAPGAKGAVEAADPRGFAKKPRSSVETHPDDFVQKKPDPGELKEVTGKKSSFDQDVTYRADQGKTIDPRTGEVKSGHVDIPKGDAKRIYNQEFYKSRHGGELPVEVKNGKTVLDANGKPEIDMTKVDDYNKSMDQASTDRLDAEAYGNGDKDLQTAVKGEHKGRDFDDVEGVGKTMEHKQNEWKNDAVDAETAAKDAFKEAEDLRAKGDVTGADQKVLEGKNLEAKSEGLKEEGFRQTTKQYGNQLEGRVDAVNKQAYQQKYGELPTKANPTTGKAEVDMDQVKDFVSKNRNNPDIKVAEIPPKLTEAVDIMKKTGAPGFSPVEVELKLKGLGYTPEKVVQQMSSNLESLQKFKLPDAPGPNMDGFTKGAAKQVNDEIEDRLFDGK